MSDRYMTFVARAEQGAKTWRVRTYGTPSDEQVESLRDEVALWAYPDEECSVRVLNEPIVPGLHYEPVNGFLNCHLLNSVEKVLAVPQNPSARPPIGAEENS